MTYFLFEMYKLNQNMYVVKKVHQLHVWVIYHKYINIGLKNKLKQKNVRTKIILNLPVLEKLIKRKKYKYKLSSKNNLTNFTHMQFIF